LTQATAREAKALAENESLKEQLKELEASEIERGNEIERYQEIC
jgi:hypothetical protein